MEKIYQNYYYNGKKLYFCFQNEFITDLKGVTIRMMAGKPVLDSNVNLDDIYASSDF
ncbi:MAG: hypothetical protein LBN93_03110 [Candidatus Symbiothrix sp.]|nr:hypothetical protein [Candidatus Symbiothrix sp.]